MRVFFNSKIADVIGLGQGVKDPLLWDLPLKKIETI